MRVIQSDSVDNFSRRLGATPQYARASSDPDREEARVVAGVLRSGEAWCAVRQRSHDEDDLVLTGSDLVPALLQLLHTTLDPAFAADPDDGESPTPDE